MEGGVGGGGGGGQMICVQEITEYFKNFKTQSPNMLNQPLECETETSVCSMPFSCLRK